MICKTIQIIIHRIKEKMKLHKRFEKVHSYDKGVIDGLNYSLDIINKEIGNEKNEE